MTIGSLFDGIGGFPLAASTYGIKTVWTSDIEPTCETVTKYHFPDAIQLGDITKINGAEIQPVDIITGGSPCQDLSVAGKRAGLEGERSGLFMEMVRIIKEMRDATNGTHPTFVVWENVPGAFSSNKGKDFQAVIQEFCKIADTTVDIPQPAKWPYAGGVMGDAFSFAWRCLDAQHWGVPQRRRRIFAVLDLGGQRAGEILFKPESVRGDSKAGGEAGQGAASDVEGGLGGSSSSVDLVRESRGAYENYEQGAEKAGALKQCDAKGTQVVAFEPGAMARGLGTRCWEDNSPTLRAEMGDNQPGVCYEPLILKERAGKPGGGKGILCGSKPFTLATNADQAVCYAVSGYDQRMTDMSQTIRSGKADHEHVGAVCYAAAFPASMGAKARGVGYAEEQSPTLASERHDATVCYSVDCRNMNLTKEHGTLQAKENGGQSLNYMGAVCYPINTMVATRHKADDGRTTFGIGENGDPQFTLGAAHEHAVCYPIDSHQQDRAVVESYTAGNGQMNQTLLKEQCRTLDCMHDQQIVLQPTKKRKYIIRRLTPTECERLQGFPDGWTQVEHRGKPMSDSARYKMLGNSVAVPCVAFIFEQIIRVTAGLKEGDNG